MRERDSRGECQRVTECRLVQLLVNVFKIEISISGQADNVLQQLQLPQLSVSAIHNSNGNGNGNNNVMCTLLHVYSYATLIIVQTNFKTISRTILLPGHLTM